MAQPAISPPQVGFPASAAYLTAQVYNPLAWIYAHLPTTVWKTGAGTSRASTITPSIDPDLQVSVTAGNVYEVYGLLIFNGGSGNDDIRIGFLAPGSSTLAWGATAQNANAVSGITYNGTSGGSMITDAQTIGNFAFIMGTIANTNGMTAHFRGLLTATSSGTFGLQWAQGTSSATATVLMAGSHMTVRQVNA